MRVLPLFLASTVLAATAERGIVYGELAQGISLTMDFEPAAGPGLHPAAIIIRSGFDAPIASLLTPLGMAVFTIDAAPPPADWRQSAGGIRRAIRYVRFNAPRFAADPNRIVLIGASSGGYLANLAGVMAGDPDRSAKDPVERVSAAVQAVVAFHAFSDLRGQEIPPEMRRLFTSDVERWGERLAFSGASPVMHIRESAPPFLLIHGDRDESVPMAQSAHWQLALQNRGIRADLIIVEGGGNGLAGWSRVPGVRPWEREMAEWLGAALSPR